MSDAYDIGWTRTSRCVLERWPEKVATAAVEFVYGPLAENPHRVGKPLRFELEGLHSALRGDYRILYRFDAEQVVIVAIEHRADVHK